jgi:peptidoglycan/xylan/chitin deacetylase (PgdA/CDA1 family)
MSELTILCYHTVDPDWRSSLAVHPDMFDRQCAWLARYRRVLPLREAVGRLDSSGRLPRGMTALTFDDGYSSLYRFAFPTLQRYRLFATVFLVAETLTAQGRPVDWIVPPPQRPVSTLTLDQILEMQSAGVEFMSHSYAHRDLDALSEEDCERDLRSSRELLEHLLGKPVPFLAYPRGRHDDRVRGAAMRAGYTHAFALPESPEPYGPMAIARVGVFPANGLPTMRIKLSRWYLSLRTSRGFPAIQAAARRLRGRA